MAAVILASELGERGMPAAVAAAQSSALEMLTAGIEVVEGDPSVPTVGRGGAPNMLGLMETDAGVMDGDTLNVGAIGALRGYARTFRLARLVMERLPHVFLVGDGAARFAAECGELPQDILTPDASSTYLKWRKEQQLSPDDEKGLSRFIWKNLAWNEKKDTVVFLVRSVGGSLAAGTSTSGWPYKYPGRLGDSPVVGAGFYADSEAGACACTHTGEMTIRAATSHLVVSLMQRGVGVEQACREGIEGLRRLKGGHLGLVTIHAFDSMGRPFVVCNQQREISYWYWSSETNLLEKRKAAVMP